LNPGLTELYMNLSHVVRVILTSINLPE